MPEVDLNDLLNFLEDEKPPEGRYIEGPLVTITGERFPLTIQIGKTDAGRLVPTGFIVGCETPPRHTPRHAVMEYSFIDIMKYINQLAIPELLEEAVGVRFNPGPKGWPDEHFEQVAKAYKAHNPHRPLRLLADQYGVDVRTLYRWIKTAREKGYLD